MPKTEEALEKLVLLHSKTRTHHRQLQGEYGYNHILGTNLVDECVDLYDTKQSTVRVLDIGCGNCFALSQLKEDIKQKGLDDKFEFYGLGKNRYEKMHIPRKNFIKTGIFYYQLDMEPFDLIISVYAFQYVWHKLEALEMIYNSLLAANGKAILHFPGYLVMFSEKSTDILRNEADGNQAFRQFIEHWNASENRPNFKFTLVPYYSDDDDRELFTEFGNLQFQKEDNKTPDFKAQLIGFGIFDEGFILNSLDNNISYISSFYHIKTQLAPKVYESNFSIDDSAPMDNAALCRVITMPQTYNDKLYKFQVGVHPLKSDVVIGIYPAVEEELCGLDVPYQRIARSLQAHGVGAVVRCNNVYDTSVEFHDFNDHFVRLFIDSILKYAKEICGTSRPKMYLMGYSSGASGIASVASEYDFIKKLLLIAPSYDADKSALEKSMNHYKGELYIVIGDRDDVILPEQAAWFYHQAKKAKIRKFVEVVSCDHAFNGIYNKEIVCKAPFWAFNDSNDFPREESMQEMLRY